MTQLAELAAAAKRDGEALDEMWRRATLLGARATLVTDVPHRRSGEVPTDTAARSRAACGSA